MLTSKRAWFSFRRSLVAIVALLLLTALSYKGPGSDGTAPVPPPTAGGSSTADEHGVARAECGETKFTVIERQTPVDCDASAFDFSALAANAAARRDGIANALTCPASCNQKTVVNVNFKPRCDSATKASVVLDFLVACAKPGTAAPASTASIPTGTLTGTATGTIGDPTFKPTEKIDESYPPVSACGQLLKYEYHEKVTSCAKRYTMNYHTYVLHAQDEVARYHAALTCIPPCHKLAKPAIVYTDWDCSGTEVVVTIYFVSCVQ